MVTGESGLRNWIGFGWFDRAEWGGLNDTYKVEHFGGVRGVLVLIDWRAELGVIVRTEEFVKEVRSVVEVLHHRREK